MYVELHETIPMTESQNHNHSFYLLALRIPKTHGQVFC